MLENLNAMELVNSMTMRQVEQLFKDSLNCQNVLTMSTAIKVLAKRGDYGAITDSINDCLKSGRSFTLGSGFAIALGQCLVDLRNGNPVLGFIGKQINRRNSGEGVYSFETLNEDLAATPEALQTKSKWVSTKLSSLDRSASEATMEAIDRRYLEALTPHELATMRADVYTGIINALVGVYMANGKDRVTATDMALQFMKKTLRPQIIELSKDKKMTEKMYKLIYNELEIGSVQ